MVKFKRAILTILTVSLYFMFILVSNKPVNLFAYSGIGEKRFEWEREIYEGVNLRHTMSYNQNKDQKTYTVTFDPKTAALKPVVTTGPGTVLYGNTMTTLINHYESQGDHVVFGFNGDGFDTSNGIPLGIGINDGKLLNSASPGRLGWGITANGEVKFGSTNLPMNFKIDNGTPINLAYVNKERKQDVSGVYFLTEDFYPTTESTAAGVEVVLTVDPGQDGLRIGQPYNVTVSNVVTVNNNPNKNKTAIGKGKAVLAAHTNSPHYNTLKNLTPGQKITVSVNDNNDAGIKWSEIVAGMGIFHLLMANGVEQNLIETNHDVHPRTVMGVKADGSIILMENDGRQVGWAAGFTYKETVEYLRDEFGAVTVFNFDGGGSSTVAATLPGDSKATVLNRPSDGRERSNANAFLLVATKNPVSSSPVEKLHIYPSIEKNYANKGIILENGKMSFNVTATDRNYYPVNFDGSQVNYRVENITGNIGSITANGVFTANSGNAKGKIIASYNGLEASYELEVTNSITSIERDVTIISVAPGATHNLQFRSLKDGVPIIMSNESLTFELNPSSLGTISNTGVYTATSGQGTGTLKVSYKDFNLSIPVEVGRMPHMIVDFEEDIFAQGWLKRDSVNMPANGGSGNLSINNDENYVKHGDGSLRIDYDFKTNPLTGTVAIEIGEPGGTVLEGQPTAISAWVYGDGNGGWFRIQLTGGVFVGDEKINWTGWKYIETPIPENTEWPITVQYPVRLLGTAAIANNTKGTIYVDSVRAIYGFQNDDNVPPVINESSVYPTNGSVTADRQQTISLNVSDANTGINRARTQMFVNGELVDNLQQIVNTDGSVDIMYNPSALTALGLGKQNIKVRIEDNFGNKTFKEWSFTVTSSSLSLNAEIPEKNSILAGDLFTYKLKADNVDNFTKMELEMLYNKESVEILGVTPGSGITIVNENNDLNNGKLSLTISGMSEVGLNSLDLIDISFKAKEKVTGTTGVFVTEAKVTDSGTEINKTLPSYDVPLKNHYVVEVEGLIYGSNSVITVKENGIPVVGATVVVVHNEASLEIPNLTDSNGKVETNLLTNYPIGTRLTVYAYKNNHYSDELSLNIIGTSGLVTMTDGASIRLKTEESSQGLRFTATLANDVKNNEHGFYLVYGNTTISELSNAINNQSGEIIINGKKVYHVVVSGVTNNNEFSVVLTGIPEAGYLDNLSAIAYVVDNGVKQFAEALVSRSVLEVALKMHNGGNGNSEITNIIEASNGNARTFALNAFNQYEVKSGLYETNHFNLKEVFIKDWNTKFNTNYKDLDALEFFESAKVGLDDGIGANKNLANSNIYKFFNDTKYKEKWGWFLDYLKEEDGTTHTTRQIDAIKGNGTNADFVLYHADHLSHSITNFFNEEYKVGGYTAINFTQTNRYSNVKDFNFNIYVDASKYVIGKPGTTVKVSEDVPTAVGYTFEYYMADSTQVMAGSTYTLGTPVKFTSKFQAINYTVKYYDGSEELTTLNRSYNIENKIDLPIPSKEGYSFLGWYDNSELTGSAITTISTGTTGNKTFYAKWEEQEDGKYNIEYVLDGGEFFLGFNTRDEMVTAFLTDFHAYLKLTISVNEFIHGEGKTSGFNGSYSDHTAELRALNDKTINPNGKFVNQPEYNYWVALIDLMDEFVGQANPTQTGQFWSSNYTANSRFKPFILKQPVGGVGAGDPLFDKVPSAYDPVELITQYEVDSLTITLLNPVKKGKTFDGWYLNSDFSGTKVTSIPTGSTGNVKLYAKWK